MPSNPPSARQPGEERCVCDSCLAARHYVYSWTCCPRGLSHGAFCTCGVTMKGEPVVHPSPPAAREPETPPHVAEKMGRLRRWANRVRGRYGVPIYLCGSALRADNPDPRDWDVRIMLPDDRFAVAFGPVDEWRDEGCTGKWTRTRFRWSDQCVKDTKDFAAWCQLNGDVQIYPESHAATVYADQPRLRLDTFPDDIEPAPADRTAEYAALLRRVDTELTAILSYYPDPAPEQDIRALLAGIRATLATEER